MELQKEKCVMVIDGKQLYQPEFEDLIVADFTDVEQGCKTYDEFIDKMAHVQESELVYLGIGICGSKKSVNRIESKQE